LNRKKFLSDAEVRKLRRTVQNKVLEELVGEIKADIEELKNRP
jgi:ribosomal protein S13